MDYLVHNELHEAEGSVDLDLLHCFQKGYVQVKTEPWHVISNHVAF